MIKYFCDRCNNEIIGNIYRINISLDTKCKNHWTAISDAFNTATLKPEMITEPPMYCERCKEKFESFLVCDL